MKYGKRKYVSTSRTKYRRRRIIRRSPIVRRRKYNRRFRRRHRRYNINKIFKEVSITQRDTYNYNLYGDGKWSYHNFSTRWEDVADKIANYILVTYDEIKLKKVTMKYWITNPMVDAIAPIIQPEILTMYDPDAGSRVMDHDNMLLSQCTKHRLLHHSRTHKLTLYPKYLQQVILNIPTTNHELLLLKKVEWKNMSWASTIIS